MPIRLHEPTAIRCICTPRRSHLPFDGGPGTPGGTYSASTWDHEADGWETRHRGLRLMALRAVIRELEQAGWSEASYLIERE